VRYRGSHLRVTVGLAGVIAVKAFAAGQIASEIIEIVDRRVPVKLVKMSVPVTPVRQRPVAIDADCIDCWRGPQRIKVECDVSRTILRLMSEVLRPIRGVRDLDSCPEQLLHL